MTWVMANWMEIVNLAWIHLQLVIPTIVASVIIAFPIGRFAFNRPKIGGMLLTASTLLYAIPALPLLVIIPALVPVQLRSFLTMYIALTVYGVALMVRSVRDAFVSVDEQVRQAATAVGYSRRSMLWKVDLPLAIPVLIAGIRVVSVSTIAMATIGALVGIPSLGSLLTDGFQRGITGEVLAGIFSVMLLALFIDVLLLFLARVLTPWRKVL
ncbi:ABC transporter permease [Arcanobacterium ihumii]|uniref:ABC transporter permease n=1 Tax=Arcanobacterium ihumii TaxID=2138162 RepID=UPI000F54845B|nr:ABC transporter permease subunit [Arcanobacterium ihumii]